MKRVPDSLRGLPVEEIPPSICGVYFLTGRMAAHALGLISDDERAAWALEERQAAEASAAAKRREQYEKLRAEFEPAPDADEVKP